MPSSLLVFAMFGRSKSMSDNTMCQKCGKLFDLTIHPVIYESADPDLAKSCLTGEIFSAACPHCGEIIHICYPMVYFSATDKFAVLFTPEDTEKTTFPDGYTIRYCRTPRDFVEKLGVLKSGKNDKAIELIKQIALEKSQRRDDCVYACFDHSDKKAIYIALLFCDDCAELVEVPMQLYNTMAKNPLLSLDQSTEIDERWAKKFMPKS